MITKKWFIIVNTTAGRGKSGKKLSAIVKELKSQDFLYEIVRTKTPLHATELAKDAIAAGFRKIVAVGGDGTLHEIVNGIMQTEQAEEVQLGIIPEGGGNDFAKNFKFPRIIKKCVSVLQKGHTHSIDVGKMGDHYFINSLGIGFDAQVAAYAKKSTRLNGLARYLLAVKKAISNLQFFDVSLELNTKHFQKTILFLTIGNGKFSGGGFQLTPQARIDDDHLDVCMVEQMNRFTMLSNLPLTLLGLHTKLTFIKMFQTKEIRIEAADSLPIYMDGELPELENFRELIITLSSRKLNFFVP